MKTIVNLTPSRLLALSSALQKPPVFFNPHNSPVSRECYSGFPNEETDRCGRDLSIVTQLNKW
jgi:hypothetical protein